jgi:histidinol-phosphate aminotransferase
MQPRDLSAHQAYVPGRGIEEVARELGRDPSEFVKLASNENPHGPSPRAVDRIRAVAGTVNHYPTSAHADLQDALAGRWSVDPEQVWLGNGGDGVLDCLARAMLEPGDGVLVPDPGFAYYPMSARYHHGEVATYPLTDDLEMTSGAVLSAYDGERVVYLTTPHNPTGAMVSLEEVRRVADGTDEETLVVVDEAYGEFCSRPSTVSLIGGDRTHLPDRSPDAPDAAVEESRDDVAVVRTFSKAYGLAGLRLGYAVVPGAWADAYAKVNTPFSAGELSCRAGLAALDDDEHVSKTVSSARRAREYMRETIDAPVRESGGNFVLVDVGDAATVADRLQREGVIVRDCTSFGLPGSIRITCGTEDETERAVDRLNRVLADLEVES